MRCLARKIVRNLNFTHKCCGMPVISGHATNCEYSLLKVQHTITVRDDSMSTNRVVGGGMSSDFSSSSNAVSVSWDGHYGHT